MSDEFDEITRVWVCTVAMEWGHTEMGQCDSALHPNCGWVRWIKA